MKRTWRNNSTEQAWGYANLLTLPTCNTSRALKRQLRLRWLNAFENCIIRTHWMFSRIAWHHTIL